MEEKSVAFSIARMEIGDLAQVLAIERQSFPSPFSEQLFRTELVLQVANLYVVRSARQGVIGYIDFWHVDDEFHLITFAVHPDWRRRGIGSALINLLLKEAAVKSIRRITLDVRPSNEAARALYAKFGFQEVTVRRGYYHDNGEDALVLSMELS